jgi:hypothetical protein
LRANVELVCYLLENGADTTILDSHRRPSLSFIPIYGKKKKKKKSITQNRKKEKKKKSISKQKTLI